MRLASHKKVNFLARDRATGLVMSVSVPVSGISETTGRKEGNDVDWRSCYLSRSIIFTFLCPGVD